MARTKAVLPTGTRIADYLSVGLLAQVCPLSKIHQILNDTGRQSQRQRDLPAHGVVYYVLALGLYMGVAYEEVLRLTLEAMSFLGSPVKREITKSALADECLMPIAQPHTKGAWFKGMRLVSVDGSTLDLAHESANIEAFGGPTANVGVAGYPQLRFAGLVEGGTHVMFALALGAYTDSEITLFDKLLPKLKPDMLVLADRYFLGYKAWAKARQTGAQLLWRAKKNNILPVDQALPDGSYLSHLNPSRGNKDTSLKSLPVRVVEYFIDGDPQAEPLYRLVTSLLDPEVATAQELAQVYHERWEIETTLKEMRTHLRGARVALRSKTPDLVRQEFYGLWLAHFAVRRLMHEAALKKDIDPDELSFKKGLQIVRCKLPHAGAVPP